jgi:hypothetical protein
LLVVEAAVLELLVLQMAVVVVREVSVLVQG